MIDPRDLTTGGGLAATSPAPVALFVYNRPRHTERVIKSLASNQLASASNLFIFSDAARTDDAAARVDEVRHIIGAVSGFKSVTVVLRERNLGLAHSIIDGVTSLCQKYGRVIVVEDDLLVSTAFLEFMNAALGYYETCDRVMHVSGYMFPVREPNRLPDTFFYRGTSCWGWATWQRAWRHFEPDARRLLGNIRQNGMQREFDILGTTRYTAMLKAQAEGRVDSWAIRWYASVFLARGLCLHPNQSLVQNIGHDGTGVHCARTNAYDVRLAHARQWRWPDDVEESTAALDAMADFYRSIRGSLRSRISRFIYRALSR